MIYKLLIDDYQDKVLTVEVVKEMPLTSYVARDTWAKYGVTHAHKYTYIDDNPNDDMYKKIILTQVNKILNKNKIKKYIKKLGS